MKLVYLGLVGFALLTAAGAWATPPGPGKRFDCSDAPGSSSCAADDTGCVPATREQLKCGVALGKALGKAMAAVIKCHAKQADAAFATANGKTKSFDEETCESAAQTKLDGTTDKVKMLCTTAQLSAAAAEEMTLFANANDPGSLDELNGHVYCIDSSTGAMIDPSGDDAGKIPTSKENLKCADTVGKNVGRLIAGAIKCHAKLAGSFFSGKDFDEESCEETNASQKGALDKYDHQRDKLLLLNICPNCLDGAGQDALATVALKMAEEIASAVSYPCTATACVPIVSGHPEISGTYQLSTLPASDPAAVKVCTTNATQNRFAICTNDAFCGGVAGSCRQTPWVDSGGITQPSPANTTTFTVTAGTFPTCEHGVCIACGALDKCAAIQGGCDDCTTGAGGTCTPASPNMHCPVSDECCQSPGFVLPALLIPGFNFCTRVSQNDCGFGVVNGSNPQAGDNEVKKEADTSDPGPDCQYGTLDDMPSPGKPCDNSAGGQGSDTAGRIKVSKGNGSADTSGIHFRMLTPGLSTTWSDTQGCGPDATFDAGEALINQLNLAAEPTSAGATGAFVDLNGDTCKRVGFGFNVSVNNNDPLRNGPYTVGPPTVIPMPYGGGSFRTVAIGEVFSQAPLFDIGFVAITPTAAPTFQGPAGSCTCPATRHCPECDAGSPGCP